jgi:hypothetical protein
MIKIIYKNNQIVAIRTVRHLLFAWFCKLGGLNRTTFIGIYELSFITNTNYKRTI